MKFFKFCVSVVLFASLVALCTCQDGKKKLCSEVARCSNADEPVWTTTDYKTCEVFRNGCLLGIENCDRRNLNEPEAKVIEKEECQKLCPRSCDKMMAPVCASYKDEPRFFSSKCELKNFICDTGKTFDVLNDGPCPDQPFVENE